MNTWKPLKDECSNIEGRYLVVIGDAEIAIASYRKYMDRFEFFRDHGVLPLRVTHWMELPPLPKDL